MAGLEIKFKFMSMSRKTPSTQMRQDRCGSAGPLELQHRDRSCLSQRCEERKNKVLQLMKAPKILLY